MVPVLTKAAAANAAANDLEHDTVVHDVGKGMTTDSG
jgi:hypothetical protein